MEITQLRKYIKEFLYFSEFGQGKKPNSIKSLKKDLEQFYEYFIIENMDFKEIDYLFLKEFIIFLQKNNVGKRSLNRKISSIRVFFRYLKDKDYIEKDPTILLVSPSFETTTPDILTEDEINRLRQVIDIERCNGLRDRLILELLYSSGITSTELLGVGESVFNLEKRELFVNNGKTSRIVFFSERTREFFRRYVEAKKIKYKEIYNKDILFVNGSGTRLSDRSLRRLIDRYAAAAKIEREISPYSFRHTFGVYMLMNGMKFLYLKELMGHSSIESTKVYQELVKKPRVIDLLCRDKEIVE
ncbi:tyrosine-type recombinase/integrase [Cetobacterium sp. SF1]|uniref:tyrosine-type recombinase/integrase n=1 Tax=Cetobacterium sp. SF1 TaxID=3417654 RepID=UPI003CEDC02C